MYKHYEKYLTNLNAKSRYRRLNTARQALLSSLLDFSTNDYLNLSKSPILLQELTNLTEKYGIGATGSRLLSGNSSIYSILEQQIAADKKTEAALTFNSGFIANLTSLAALLDEQVLGSKAIVFFDKLNHASLYQAIFLSRANLCRYQHNNIDNLSELLKKYKNDNSPKFIVTESIFGMDGDLAKLAEISQLAKEYNCFLYIDEAHATGVLGENGYGCSTSLDLTNVPHLIMGSFSKALGSSGGYIASDNIIINYLINKAQGFIYSTAPSPIIAGVNLKAWEYVSKLDNERNSLQLKGKILRDKLQAAGFDTGLSESHIVPIIFKEEEICLKVQKQLASQNIIVSCIRPPTVPPNSSRIRIALSSKHSLSDLDHLVEQLKDII